VRGHHRDILHRLLPPAAVLAAAAGLLHLGLLAEIAPARFTLGLRLVLAAALALAWRLRSAQAARAAVLLLALGALLNARASETLAPTLLLIRVLLPLDLALGAWLRDASLLSRRGILRFGWLGVEAALVSPLLLERLASLGLSPTLLASWVPAVTLVAGASGLVLRVVFRPTPLSAGWLGVLLAATVAFEAQQPMPWLVAGGLTLFVALVERAFALAFEDRLTGLAGRAALEQRLGELGERYAIAMVDVDHFKKVNDRHGHDTGDEVLRWVASRLNGVSGGGAAYRYGGEEFDIVFAGRDAAAAKAHLEALRQSIAERPFVLRPPRPPAKRARAQKSTKRPAAQRTLAVTVSIGLAASGARAKTPTAVLKAADKDLYRAKRAGRNRLSRSRG